MRLGIKELEVITLGVLRIKEEGGWFTFHRFGKELETCKDSWRGKQRHDFVRC